VGVDCEEGIGDVFADVVNECFFATGVFQHEIAEVEDAVLEKEEGFVGGFCVGDPVFHALCHSRRNVICLINTEIEGHLRLPLLINYPLTAQLFTLEIVKSNCR
jgi:hypothetical protein